VILDDRSGRIEVTMSEEIWQRHRELLVKDALILVEGSLRFDEFSDAWRIHARSVQALDSVRERLARRLLLDWPGNADSTRLLNVLAELLKSARGGDCAVTVRYASAAAGAQTDLPLAAEWNVHATAELLEQLQRRIGRVRVVYGPPGGASSVASA
jgi:DNA polymerase-3 subunit alpha